MLLIIILHLSSKITNITRIQMVKIKWTNSRSYQTTAINWPHHTLFLKKTSKWHHQVATLIVATVKNTSFSSGWINNNKPIRNLWNHPVYSQSAAEQIIIRLVEGSRAVILTVSLSSSPAKISMSSCSRCPGILARFISLLHLL